MKLLIYKNTSAVKRLIATKVFVYIIYVCAVYISVVLLNTRIYKKIFFCLYIKYIYMLYKLYEYKYIHVSTRAYFQTVYLCIVNIHTKQKL